MNRATRWAGVPLFVLASAAVGLAEGVHDLLDGGSEASFARAGWILAYAACTWCVPAVGCLLLGFGLSGLLGLVGLPRRQMLGVSFGAGLLVALVAWQMGRGAESVLGGGLGAVLVTRFLLPLLWRRRPMAWSVGACVALLAAFAGATWLIELRVTRASTTAEPKGLRVVVIVADALRADALSAYGGQAWTPDIDRIGDHGWVVPDTLSTSSWTLPAVASLWSSRSPRWHGVTTYSSVLPGDLPVLPEALKAAGCVTAAVVANPLIDPDRGFLRGFDLLRGDTHQVETSFFWVLRFNRWLRSQGLVTGPNAERKFLLPSLTPWDGSRVRRTGYMEADEVTGAALDLLDEVGDRDFFLYLHYLDPHDPYLAHPTGLKVVEPPLRPGNKEELQRLYAGEVAFLDQQVGVLREEMERRGLWKDTLVVFTADHGEEFLDHGGWLHGESLHDELVRVPLLVHFPASVGVPRVPAEASLIDLAPTILATLGLPSLSGAAGVDLRTGGARGPRYADRTSDRNWLAAVRTRDRHWIGTLAEDGAQMVMQGYDRGQDPQQLQDLAGAEVPASQQAAGLLRQYFQEARPASERALSKEEEARLRAMGYLK